MSLLNPIKSQWREIGEQLEVPHGELQSIQHNVAYDDTRRLSEVFRLWIDRTTEVSWRTILDVVRDPPVDNKRLEEEIRQFISRPDIQHIYLSTNGKTTNHS